MGGAGAGGGCRCLDGAGGVARRGVNRLVCLVQRHLSSHQDLSRLSQSSMHLADEGRVEWRGERA